MSNSTLRRIAMVATALIASCSAAGKTLTKVRSSLAAVATVPGVIFFAVGRTTFWDALVGSRARTITRDAAVQHIAHRYRKWVDIFERRRIQDPESDRFTVRALRRWENEGGRV